MVIRTHKKPKNGKMPLMLCYNIWVLNGQHFYSKNCTNVQLRNMYPFSD
ncbi:Uncharacterised protein [Mycobacteroides abscessus subsp. abscessus]|nr:Uncharacterised protein [Mycobacteroides abscessus subsp. abscessus]